MFYTGILNTRDDNTSYSIHTCGSLQSYSSSQSSHFHISKTLPHLLSKFVSFSILFLFLAVGFLCIEVSSFTSSLPNYYFSPFSPWRTWNVSVFLIFLQGYHHLSWVNFSFSFFVTFFCWSLLTHKVSWSTLTTLPPRNFSALSVMVWSRLFNLSKTSPSFKWQIQVPLKPLTKFSSLISLNKWFKSKGKCCFLGFPFLHYSLRDLLQPFLCHSLHHLFSNALKD